MKVKRRQALLNQNRSTTSDKCKNLNGQIAIDNSDEYPFEPINKGQVKFDTLHKVFVYRINYITLVCLKSGLASVTAFDASPDF